MSPKTGILIRYWVLFWIITSLVVTALALLIVAVGGYVTGPSAQGVLAQFAFGAGFFAMLAPVIAAHIVTCAAIIGVLGIAAGVRPDWKLLAAIVIGLIAGTIVLRTLYIN